MLAFNTANNDAAVASGDENFFLVSNVFTSSSVRVVFIETIAKSKINFEDFWCDAVEDDVVPGGSAYKWHCILNWQHIQNYF